MNKQSKSVGILSDTHGQIDERIAEIVLACDVIVHAGDIGGAEVLGVLQAEGKPVIAVRGNNDVSGRWPASQEDVRTELPLEAIVDLPGGQLLVVHGDQMANPGIRHDQLRRKYGEVRAIVYGHSHRLVCDLMEEPWVLNPGAAGRNRTFGGPSCLVLHADLDSWRMEEHRFELQKVSRRA